MATNQHQVNELEAVDWRRVEVGGREPGVQTVHRTREPLEESVFHLRMGCLLLDEEASFTRGSSTVCQT